MFNHVDSLIEKNPTVLGGYVPGSAAETESLIAKHRATKLPPDRLMTTESPHPLTLNLSQLAQKDLPAAYDVLYKVDHQALERLKPYQDKINDLAQTFAEVLKAGHSIKMSGCGAAARAATLAECLYRKSVPDLSEQVSAINAGGDLVIVRAAEGFEDRNDYGVLQLQESGWRNGDLLVGVSASGAAGFVNGQINYLLNNNTQRKPIFLICNPLEDCLTRFADDEKTIFHHSKRDQLKKVEVLDICVGEMSLSGSTRMQAATVQLLVLSFALIQASQILRQEQLFELDTYLSTLQCSLTSMPMQDLSTMTRFEVQAYKANNYMTYNISPECALTVATDTTERSPTFNWDYFENDGDKNKTPSKSRIIIKGYDDNELALKAMLGRELRTLDWMGEQGKPNEPKTARFYLLGYDLTQSIVEKRKQYMPKAHCMSIDIQLDDEQIVISFSNHTTSIPLKNDLPTLLKPLYQQLMLKLILNTHSTLVAGQLGCYQGNLMTSVRTSNLKLINRGIALSNEVIRSSFFQRRLPPPEVTQHQITPYEITEMLYTMMLIYRPGESIVFNTAHSVLFNYETYCYSILLSIHMKSSALTQSSVNKSSSKDEVPFLTDIEIAQSITQGSRPAICIEGGGTYFRFSLVSPYNELQMLTHEDQYSSTIKVPGGNCNAIGWDNFTTLLDHACQSIYIEDQDLMAYMQHEQPLIIIGMAGMAAEANRLKLIAHLTHKTGIKQKQITITSDADTYLAALPGMGAVLIAGTGSICLGLTSLGKRIQAGGLGAQFSGDPGSAYAVGKNALLACLQLRNGGIVWNETHREFIANDDPLFLAIKDRVGSLFNISFEHQAVAYFNREHGERLKLAELAPLVFEYAFDRTPASPLAKKIIVEIAFDLAKLLGETMEGIFRKEQAPQKNSFPVILIGGLFDSPYHKHLVELIQQVVNNMHPKINIEWQHEPSQNYVSQVVQQAMSPASVYRFGM